MYFDNGTKTRLALSRFGKENTRRIILLKKALLLERNKRLQLEHLRTEENLLKEELKKKPPMKISDLAINGNDLIELGLPEGKIIGRILENLYKKVIDNPALNEKEYLKKFVQKYHR